MSKKFVFLFFLFTFSFLQSQTLINEKLCTNPAYIEDQLTSRGFNSENLKKDPIYLGIIDKVAYYIYNPKYKDYGINLVGIYNNVKDDEELFNLEMFETWTYHGKGDVLRNSYKFKNPDEQINPLIDLINSKIESRWYTSIRINYYLDEYALRGHNYYNENLEKPISRLSICNRVKGKIDWWICSVGSDGELIGVTNSINQLKEQLKPAGNVTKDYVSLSLNLKNENEKVNNEMLNQFLKENKYMVITEEKWNNFPSIEYYLRDIYEGKFDNLPKVSYNENRMNYIFRVCTNYVSNNCNNVLPEDAVYFEFQDVYDGGSEYSSTTYLGRGLYIDNYRELPDQVIKYKIKMEPRIKNKYEEAKRNGLFFGGILLSENPAKVVEARAKMAEELNEFIKSIGCNENFWKLLNRNFNSFMIDKGTRSVQEEFGIEYKETNYRKLYKHLLKE